MSRKEKKVLADKNEKKYMDIPNSYEILGVSQTASQNEIRLNYLRKSKKYHPDNRETGDDKIFTMIQKAYNFIGTEENRKEYDFYLNAQTKVKSGDWLNTKDDFDEFIKLQEKEASNPESIAKAGLEFKKAFTELDKKRKFDRKKYEEKPMSSKEANDRFNEMRMEREQQEIEFMQKRLFPEGAKFDNNMFQHAFEKMKDKSEKIKKNKQIVKKSNGPEAWEANNLTSLDNFGSTFDEENEESTLDQVFGEKYDEIDVNEDDLDYDEIKTTTASNYSSKHNADRDGKYADDLEKMMKDRVEELKKYDGTNMSYNDFKNNPDELDQCENDFMFTHKLGYIGGLSFEEFNKKDDGDIDDDLETYERYLAYENKNKK